MSEYQQSDNTPTYKTAPPTYDGLPVIGNTHQLVREQDGLYEAAARHGDVVHLQLLGIGDLYQVNHPDLAELEEVLTADHATFEELPELAYTEQVVREVMRLYPPVPSIPRETTQVLELGGYTLPEEATVVPMQWTIHRDKRFWRDPLTFRPERFVGEDDRPQFAYSRSVAVLVGVSANSSRSPRPS